MSQWNVMQMARQNEAAAKGLYDSINQNLAMVSNQIAMLQQQEAQLILRKVAARTAYDEAIAAREAAEAAYRTCDENSGVG